MTAILWMLGGALIGAVVSLILYVLGFGIEILNCACQIITCNCSGDDAIPGMWEDGAFFNVLIFCAIAGAIIGLIYGLYKMKIASDEEAARKSAEDSEAARQQRVKWAEEIKQKALTVSGTCDKNKSADKPLVSTTYQASSKMKDILFELTKVAELQGKVDSIADDLTERGGDQE